jgi:hypothetical protein
VDILISFAWFAAFGVLVDTIRHLPCGSIWSWHFRGDQTCGRWKAAEAFSFLSAIVWLVSAIVVCDENVRYVPRYDQVLMSLQGIWFTFRVRNNNSDGT